jgi:MSHA biogenesis protein MshK
MAGGMTAMIALILGVMTAGLASAQGLSDPTRPPGGQSETAEAVGPGGPVLQSVMLSPSRKVAVISGEMVVLGGRYGSSKLVRLTETEAVLKNGADVTVLRLHPLVEKRAVSGAATKSTVKKTK